jgi:hypothetical protein
VRTVTVVLMVLTFALLAVVLGQQWRADAAGRLPAEARGPLRASTILLILAVALEVASLVT